MNNHEYERLSEYAELQQLYESERRLNRGIVMLFMLLFRGLVMFLAGLAVIWMVGR